MPTTLPRPRVGAEIRVRPDLTRTFLDADRAAEPDPHAGEHGIVIGYDVAAPSLDRATGDIGGTTWDLQVVFLGGRGSVYDMDEVEILYGGPWTKAANAADMEN